MADINNNDIWIDVETLAKLKNITRRAVRLALNQNKYEYKVENIRGGKTYKIKLSTLEKDLQLNYFQEYYDDYKTCENEVIELSNLNIKQEKLISENQRKIALAKYDLIYASQNMFIRITEGHLNASSSMGIKSLRNSDLQVFITNLE